MHAADKVKDLGTEADTGEREWTVIHNALPTGLHSV